MEPALTPEHRERLLSRFDRKSWNETADYDREHLVKEGGPIMIYDQNDIAHARKIIADNDVTVLYDDDRKTPGWGMSWRHGTMTFGGKKDDSERGEKMIGLFLHLYLTGLDAGLARDLSVCYFRVVL